MKLSDHQEKLDGDKLGLFLRQHAAAVPPPATSLEELEVQKISALDQRAALPQTSAPSRRWVNWPIVTATLLAAAAGGVALLYTPASMRVTPETSTEATVDSNWQALLDGSDRDTDADQLSELLELPVES